MWEAVALRFIPKLLTMLYHISAQMILSLNVYFAQCEFLTFLHV